MLLMQQQELSGGGYPPDAFVFTTKETFDNITIPTRSGIYTYNYNIETSDGQTFTGVTGNQTINFPSTGSYEVIITGTFPQPYFANGSESPKILDIKQWGNPNWGTDFFSAFYGCTFLTCSATDSPFSHVVNGYQMFRRAFGFSLTEHMNFENVTNGREMFRETSVRDFPIGMELANLQIAPNLCFQVTGAISAPSLNFASLLGGAFPNGIANAFYNGVISTVDYSNILIRAEANNPNNNVRFDGFQNSKYNSSALSARNALLARGWILADAGLE